MRSTFAILDITGSAGPELITLEDLKVALGITDDDEDAALTASILRQSRLIAEICDRRFGFAEAIEVFTFAVDEVLLPRQALTLRLYPVEEVFTVVIGGSETTDYDFDGPSGRIWLDGSWQGEVIITYSGGYQLPDEAPAGLQEALIQAISDDRASSSAGAVAAASGVREVAHGDTRVAYFNPVSSSASSRIFSSTVMDLLGPYKRLAFA